MGKRSVKKDPVVQEEEYVEFLRKRMTSENFKANSTKEEQDDVRKKYDKAKLKLKFLKETPR